MESGFQAGIHMLYISRGDTEPAHGEVTLRNGAQVNKDAFVDQSSNGFVATVKNTLALIGGGKAPKNYLLVLSERAEDSYSPFFGGVIEQMLERVTKNAPAETHRNTCGRDDKKGPEYMPILVCILGQSQSFKRWCWGGENKPAAEPENPVCVFTPSEFAELAEMIKELHAEILVR